MIELILKDNKLTLSDIVYSFDDIQLIDENQVNIHLYNSEYNSIYALISNETTINGVLQTSAQMIIDTLNGQS